MNHRPTYSRWSRKAGGVKVCLRCRHKHKPVMRIDGKPQRVRTCVECGAELPVKLRYPNKSMVKWFVREFQPTTGKTRDHACRSSEEADELIRAKQRDYTPDRIQEQLIESASTLIRQIEAESYEDAVSELIRKLGGDPTRRSLKTVGWNEAARIIADELRQKGRSAEYIAGLICVATDFRTISGLDSWQQLDLDAVATYRRIRMAGGWKRNGRTVKPVRGRAINRDLATLSAFLTRAVRKGWVASNVLENAPDERVKCKTVRVRYMPDEDLRVLIGAADEAWLRALIIVAYYTGARRSDLLDLEWDRDVDLNGKLSVGEGRSGPHVFISGNKADTPHWVPLHPAAVQALLGLRRQPVIDRKVFPVRGSSNPGSRVSHAFAKLCVDAGLTENADRDGRTVVKNRWSLHDLRRKANTDLRNGGASAKERAALLGHRTTTVNELHYEALLPDRERSLIDALPTFGMAV